jgi:hypothetical protein
MVLRIYAFSFSTFSVFHKTPHTGEKFLPVLPDVQEAVESGRRSI